ncbi:siroheme synthase (plasmid) [Phyllobacterium sp. 628]|uniref:NAD(P)-dependent oxidoreductase n=1 Tax=Phyllobacterium sp. 628 TaxID=2718938 RepID=UPI0016622348|nr:NAD(P)-dependent oxidoreductase [Phyllobacterium sp. 628]QND50428.1 siroheme synthase [Phyllobacterium sp. 628]
MQILSGQQSSPAFGSIGRLAVLPVFFNLRNKRGIVAGGTAAAAWKAELLSAAGGDVHVYAEIVSEEMSALIAAGICTHHAQPWSPASLESAAIAVADAANDVEARAFANAAEKAGVPCNVIDQPEFCQFQFGSIVNRSPVVVGISTDGAAPILGQAIRRRIESVLPASLSAWAQLAQRLRGRISEILLPGTQRRVFWEHLVDRAFGTDPAPHDEASLIAKAMQINGNKAALAGSLNIISVASDDPELMTLKAMRLLQMADVIIHSPQICPMVLQLGRREAKRLLANESGDDVMENLQSAGKHVVFLSRS